MVDRARLAATGASVLAFLAHQSHDAEAAFSKDSNNVVVGHMNAFDALSNKSFRLHDAHLTEMMMFCYIPGSALLLPLLVGQCHCEKLAFHVATTHRTRSDFCSEKLVEVRLKEDLGSCGILDSLY